MTAITHAGLSDVGRVRQENEDRWFADAKQGLYLVADGMGGSIAGGVAAQIVVQVLPRLLRPKLDGVKTFDDPGIAEHVIAVIVELSDRLRNESKLQFGGRVAGSTVVLAVVREHRAIIAHLGDSRAYLLHDANLQPLTRDHSIVQLLLDTGELTAEEARQHPARGQLTRHVGMQSEPLPDATVVDLVPGDRLLLCSDGLCGVLDHLELAAILRQQRDPEKACQRLISTANNAGGEDNITAVVLAVSDICL